MTSSKKDKRLIPTSNIGIFGHVAHGKTTLASALTGKVILKHSEELKRGITIKLGYADIRIYKCKNCARYSNLPKCPYCFSDTELIRTVSLIDAPGHETLMSTVLTGSSIINGAILVIAANEKCPQPQTREHLIALEAAEIKNLIVVQTKIDLVTKDRAIENYNEIKDFLKGTVYENSPIIPVSSPQKVNLDKVFEYIDKLVPEVEGDKDDKFKMFVVRSFDINKPGTDINDILGGVIGGSIIRGYLKINEEITILPGLKVNENYVPLYTRAVNLRKGEMDLDEASVGGLLSVLTDLDPYITKADNLIGNFVFKTGEEIKPTYEITFNYKILERVVGSKEVIKTKPLELNEVLLLNVGVIKTIGSVVSIKNDVVTMKLKIPVCAESGEKVTISRNINNRWRLIGYGKCI